MRHINKNYAAQDNHECDKDMPILSQMSKCNHYDMEITFIRHKHLNQRAARLRLQGL